MSAVGVVYGSFFWASNPTQILFVGRRNFFAPDTVMTADWALKAYKYTTLEADDMKKLAKNPLDALNKSNNRILKYLVIMWIESRLILY